MKITTCKKLIGALVLAFVLAFTPLAPVFLTGCGTAPTSESAVAYQTLKSVQILADKAMKVYGTAVVTGKVSVEKQATIDDTHLRYRNAFRLAVEANSNDLNSISPAEVSRLADELQTLITQL